MINNFQDKKVLIMGLGLLGGGIASAQWFVKHGAKVTVTDLQTSQSLSPSIKKLGQSAKKIKFVLGQHLAADFRNNEIIVVNPAVPQESPYLKIARASGATLENEASIFFRFCKNPVIAVTGTRGKTTTASWIHYFLKKKYPRAILAGNSSSQPMLAVLDKLDGISPVVVELSSWHLELFHSDSIPHIAIITNIFRDHQNRYPSIRSYVLAKANIFQHQTNQDTLLLNKNDSWTPFFRRLRPKSAIFYFPQNIKGVNKTFFEKKYGKHNWENLVAAIFAVRAAGLPIKNIKKTINFLPIIPFREEIIISKKNFLVVNDSAATSPDATIAALHRFQNNKKTLILITGGTDKNLDFKEWAKVVKKHVPPENLFLLNGTATKKMIQALKKINYFQKSPPQLFENLKTILTVIKKNSLLITHYSLLTILFSPSSASFEKFQNEFDRGEKFNLYSKKLFK